MHQKVKPRPRRGGYLEKKMKYEYNFNEMAEIFAAVANIEDKFNALQEAESKYDDLSNTFDAEFAALGYTFTGASQEVHDLFDAKCAALDDRDKAERAVFKAVKKFISVAGVGENYIDCDERDLIDFVSKKYHYSAERIVADAKYIAKRAVSYIK